MHSTSFSIHRFILSNSLVILKCCRVPSTVCCEYSAFEIWLVGQAQLCVSLGMSAWIAVWLIPKLSFWYKYVSFRIVFLWVFANICCFHERWHQGAVHLSTYRKWIQPGLCRSRTNVFSNPNSGRNILCEYYPVLSIALNLFKKCYP